MSSSGGSNPSTEGNGVVACGIGFVVFCLLWKLCGGSITDIGHTIVTIIIVAVLIYAVLVFAVFCLKTFCEWVELYSQQVQEVVIEKKQRFETSINGLTMGFGKESFTRGIMTNDGFQPTPGASGSRITFDPPSHELGNAAGELLVGGLMGGLSGIMNKNGGGPRRLR